MSTMSIDSNPAVTYSFGLYVLYVLLPLIPAILIFKLFPDTKVALSGPLQHFTLNTTGAFAAYVVTAALGFFLVKDVEQQIVWTTHYAVEGAIVDLEQNQVLDSDQFFARYTNDTFANGTFAARNYLFVVLLDHPVVKPEKVLLKYWELNGPGGIGEPPPSKTVPIELSATTSPQRFRLRITDGNVQIVPETLAGVNSSSLQ